MINVLFVEDQPLVSEATAEKIARSPSVANIEICNSAEKALLALKATPDRWGLILLDLDVPGAVGLSLAMKIKKIGKEGCTCILTGTYRADYIAQTKAIGFQGYILKAIEIKELEASLDKAIAGEKVFPDMPGLGADSGAIRLTNRQCQCLEFVGAGQSTKEIARLLSLHPGTVNYHIDSAMEALGVKSRAHAVQKALQLGLLAGYAARSSDGNT